MGLPSYFEDIDELATELASNLTGEEVRYWLAKVGWQPTHTKIVIADTHGSRAPGEPQVRGDGTSLLKQFLESVIAKLKRDQERARDLAGEVAGLRQEIERLKKSRDQAAERSRTLQTKLKDLSTARTHRHG